MNAKVLELVEAYLALIFVPHSLQKFAKLGLIVPAFQT